MSAKNKERRSTVSCGGLPWRIINVNGAFQLQVLLIKQFAHKDSWGIPKGHVQDSETHEQCALREIFEETGVKVTLLDRLPDVGTTFRDEDKTVVSWLARPVGNEDPTHDDPDSEVADARWFNIDELPTIHIYQRPLLATATEMLRTAIRSDRVDVGGDEYHSTPEE